MAAEPCPECQSPHRCAARGWCVLGKNLVKKVPEEKNTAASRLSEFTDPSPAVTLMSQPEGGAMRPAIVEQHGAYNKTGFGVKADQGKPQWHLLPLQFLRGVVRVLMKGAVKYAPHNWRKGMPWSQTYSAALRHLDAFWSGEDADPETGEHHIDHALCCLVFLRSHVIEYPALDDRHKPVRNTAVED